MGYVRRSTGTRRTVNDVADLCETTLDLAVIASDTTWVVDEQIRLFRKYLQDDFVMSVYDNSLDMKAAWDMEQLCARVGIRYVRVPLAEEVRIPRRSTLHRVRLHEHALLHASADLMNRQAPVIGFMDHDIFPVKPTSILALVEPQGFFGVGQRHPDSQRIYLWPGFVFFSRVWLNGRTPDFGCLEHGDTGSKLAELVTAEEVASLPEIAYSYEWIRQTDGRTHSDAVERIGDMLHLTNTTRWNRIPDRIQRDQLVRQLVRAL